MSFSLGTLTIAAGVKDVFEAPQDGARGVLIGNESGLTCTITMEGAGVQKTLYPSTVDWFDIRPGFTGTIRIAPAAILSSASSYPSSELLFDAIGPRDPEQASQYPLALVRNTNVGNTTPLSVSASSLTNTADAPGTTEISLQDKNHNSPQFTVSNEGNVTSQGFLDFDNGSIISNGAGTLTVEQIDFKTTARIDFGAYGLTQLDIYCNGTKVAHLDSSGNLVLKGALTQNGAP